MLGERHRSGGRVGLSVSCRCRVVVGGYGRMLAHVVVLLLLGLLRLLVLWLLVDGNL